MSDMSIILIWILHGIQYHLSSNTNDITKNNFIFFWFHTQLTHKQEDEISNNKYIIYGIIRDEDILKKIRIGAGRGCFQDTLSMLLAPCCHFRGSINWEEHASALQSEWHCSAKRTCSAGSRSFQGRTSHSAQRECGGWAQAVTNKGLRPSVSIHKAQPLHRMLERLTLND
jgi:hypothetical protein